MSLIEKNVGASESQEFKDKRLSCPICFDVFDKPLVCGTCGNTFCKNCVLGMKYVCPLCRKVTEYNKNVALEHLISNLPILCKCNKYFPKNELDEHLIFCPFHEQRCKVCNFVGNLEQRTIHGIDEHPEIIRNMFLVFKG